MLGKRAQIEDFGEFIMAGIVIAILVYILVFFLARDIDRNTEEFHKELAMLEASYTTRMILQHELEPGYKVYEKILDLHNSGASKASDYDPLYAQIDGIFHEYYASSAGAEWTMIINGYHIDKELRIELFNVVWAIPSVLIPNPEGDNVKVLIFEIKPIHRKFRSSDMIDRVSTAVTQEEADWYGVRLDEEYPGKRWRR